MEMKRNGTQMAGVIKCKSRQMAGVIKHNGRQMAVLTCSRKRVTINSACYQRIQQDDSAAGQICHILSEGYVWLAEQERRLNR